MEDFLCVSARSLKVKFKFEKVKICVVATYDPSEGNVEKSTIFWDNLNDVLDEGNRRFSSFATYLPIQGFFFTVVTTTHGQSPIQGGGVLLSKVHPLAQITHMSTDAGFKVRRLNSVGNTEDGREFHKTEGWERRKHHSKLAWSYQCQHNTRAQIQHLLCYEGVVKVVVRE